MNIELIRSIGAGPIGAMASAFVAHFVYRWQVKRWSRWLPQKFGVKGRNRLLSEHKVTIRIAKALSVAGFCVGLLFYTSGWLNDHDWRGAGIAFGLMSILPIGYIVAANVSHGRERIKEALVAFAIDQKTPPYVLFGFMAVCIVAGVLSAASLLFRP